VETPWEQMLSAHLVDLSQLCQEWHLGGGASTATGRGVCRASKGKDCCSEAPLGGVTKAGGADVGSLLAPALEESKRRLTTIWETTQLKLRGKSPEEVVRNPRGEKRGGTKSQWGWALPSQKRFEREVAGRIEHAHRVRVAERGQRGAMGSKRNSL